MLTNVPRISDVEVMARLLLDLGAEVEGIGSTTLRVRCRTIVKDEPDARAGRPAARFGAAARPAAGAARARAPGAAGRRFSGAAHDLDAPRGARSRWARACRRAPATMLEAPDGLKPDVDLSVRSVGHRHRDGAARRGRGARHHRRSATPRASRTSSSSAQFLRKLGVGITGAGTSTIRIEGGAQAGRRRAPAVGRLHRGRAAGRSSPRSPAARSTSAARAPRTWRSSRAVLTRMNIERCRWTATCSASSSRSRVRPAASRPACGRASRAISSACHRAGDAGRGPDAGARLAVRAAAVRAGAAERHGRRSVPLRSAPHHRHRPAAAARPPARQPRPAIGHGADCRGAGRRRARAGCRRSRRSSAATAGSSSGCRDWARKVAKKCRSGTAG